MNHSMDIYTFLLATAPFWVLVALLIAFRGRR